MQNKEFSIFYKRYLDSIRNNTVNIDITYRCPLECPFCQRQQEGIKEKLSRSSDLSIQDYTKVVKFFKDINFCGQISDPIYHPQFLEMIKFSNNYKSKTFQVHTNGTRKRIDWWEEIFNNTDGKVVWFFGLDGTDQETASLYRVNTKFDEVMQVMKLGVRLGKTICWQFIVFKHNEHQIQEATQIAKENNIELVLIKSPRYYTNEKISLPSSDWKSKYKVTKQLVWVK
jgi:MoaA/NifB/PqqE/SkfB family radical SAM enzyme